MVTTFEPRDLVTDEVRLYELVGLNADGNWLAIDAKEPLTDDPPHNLITLDANMEGLRLVLRAGTPSE